MPRRVSSTLQAALFCVLVAGCAGRCRHASSGSPLGAAKASLDLGTPAPASSNAALAVNVCGGPSYAFPAGPRYATQTGEKELARVTTWAPGVPGGVPKRSVVCKTLSPLGKADDAQINDAIEHCPDNQVVKLNPGNYEITNAILWRKSHVVLRGSGGPGASRANQTRLLAKPSLYGPVVNIGPDLFPHPTGPSVNVTEDALQGAKSVKVSSVAGLKPGDLVQLDMTGDPANDTGKWLLDAPNGKPTLAYPYAEYDSAKMPKGSDSRTWFTRPDRPIGQVLEIKAIEGDRLIFTTPFHQTFDVAHAAQVIAFQYNGENSAPLDDAGLEDLYVAGAPAPGGQAQSNNVVFMLAKNSWVRNVESAQSLGTSIGINSSIHCTVRDSYMHSTVNPTPGGAGYGLAFSLAAADNLAENNISWNFNKIMVMRASGGGNVVAYNYMDDGYIAYQPNWMETGLNAAHMTTAHFELFEGNLSFTLGSESTWGNATFITWLRNIGTAHRSAWPPLNAFVYDTKANKPGGCVTTGPFDQGCIPYTDKSPRAAAVVSFGHVFYNFVGNVLGSRDIAQAPQTHGFAYQSEGPEWPTDPVPMWLLGFHVDSKETDRNVVATTFRDANFDYATKTVQPAAGRTIPASLYLCQKPSFFGAYSWPWVDGSNAAAPYQAHPYRFHALSPSLGTFETSGELVNYSGFALPAFVRFLQLSGVEPTDAACTSAPPGEAPPACSLLLTGLAP